MQKTQLSKRAQIGLVLGIMLLFSLIATVVGYLGADQVREQLAAFRSQSVTVTGTVVDKRIVSVRPTAGGIWVYWLDLAFKTAEGSARSPSIQVANSIFDRYRIGSPVQVTYVKSNPDWFYVPGAEPTEREAGAMAATHKYGAIAAVVFAVALVGFLFMSRGGGTPAPASGVIAPQPSTGPSTRGMPRQPRASFGTRGFGK